MPDFPHASVPEIMPSSQENPSPEEGGLEADERAYEALPESKEHFLEQPDAVEPGPTSEVKAVERRPPTGAKRAAPTIRQTDEITLKVEHILEEGLGDMYQAMPPDRQTLFKQKGEEIATLVADMVRTFKIHVGKLVRLIREWLMLIPKVNRFFLEQEAKIKADAILEYVEARREEQNTKK